MYIQIKKLKLSPFEKCVHFYRKKLFFCLNDIEKNSAQYIVYILHRQRVCGHRLICGIDF